MTSTTSTNDNDVHFETIKQYDASISAIQMMKSNTVLLLYTVDAGGLSRLGLVKLDHGQLIAPHDVTSTSSTDELTFPRRTVAEMMDPVMLAAVNIQLSKPS